MNASYTYLELRENAPVSVLIFLERKGWCRSLLGLFLHNQVADWDRHIMCICGNKHESIKSTRALRKRISFLRESIVLFFAHGEHAEATLEEPTLEAESWHSSKYVGGLGDDLLVCKFTQLILCVASPFSCVSVDNRR